MKDILFLVEGDELSRQLKEEVKNAEFGGDIVTFSIEEARQQRTPLPLLVTGGTTYGPTLLRDYFRPRGRSDCK